jgi:HlyD family secretion protein
MKRAFVIGIVVIVVVAAIGGGWWTVNQNPELWFLVQDELDKAVTDLGLAPKGEPQGLVASGFIEAEEASVTTQVGGRIVALYADEGDEVDEGGVVAQLDDSLLLAQMEMAKADLAVVEARLAQVKAGVRQETLNHAQAMLKQAVAAQAAALVAWEDAQAMLENPQDLELAITAARSQLGVLDQQVRRAQAMANSAQVARDLTDEIVSLIEDFEPFTLRISIAPGVDYKERIKLPPDALPRAKEEQAKATYQSWEAWAGLSQVEATRDGAADYLAELLDQRADPLHLRVQADAAKAEYEIASAAVEVAKAALEGLHIGATPEQIAAVEAQVEVARAALAALVVQQERFALEAPIAGLVLERPVHVGGQPVTVTVDAYPDRTFGGTVSFIASEAEFTPKNVQTREERVNMVFAVKVQLLNPDHALKPGMPADAVLPVVESGK